MKAINLSEPWKIAVKELEKPVPKEGEALIRVISAGICGSDIGAFRGTNNLVSYPRIIGHELAGIIEQVPEDNPKGFKVGDKVIYSKYAGTEVKIDGEEVMLIRQSDILATVE